MVLALHGSQVATVCLSSVSGDQNTLACGEIILKKMIFSKSDKGKSARENPRANDLVWRKVLCAQPMDSP